MNTTPDCVQVDQLPVAFQKLQCPTNDEQNTLTAPSACGVLVPAPENYESETRSPLKELSENSKANIETPEQEQEQEQNENDAGVDKLNEYVTKVLEKLVKQRNKMAKLNSVLEKKGLTSEKNLAQLQTMVQEIEDMAAEGNEKEDSVEEAVDDTSKENLSPLRNRQIALQETKTSSPAKAARSFTLEDVLQISRTEINYGTRFPGQVVEEHLEIINKSTHDFVVQIHVSCFNPELQETEEYVYSVRRSHLYDYNDKHYLIMAPYSCAAFKFALKVPNMKFTGKILGQIKVCIQGLAGSYTLDLTTDVCIPKIFCPKELTCNGLDYKVIKLAIKEGKKQDIKIPIRNNSDVPVTLELEFHDPPGSKETQGRQLFDCLVHPNVINIAPNGTTLTNIVVKPWRILSGIKGLEKPKPSRKIMIGRVRESALVYSFVFWIEIY